MVLALYPADVIAAADANLSADPTASIESLPPAYRRVWALRSTGLFVTALLTCFPYAIWSCFDVGFTVWFVGEFEYSVLTATMFFTIAPATYSRCKTVCMRTQPPANQTTVFARVLPDFSSLARSDRDGTCGLGH